LAKQYAKVEGSKEGMQIAVFDSAVIIIATITLYNINKKALEDANKRKLENIRDLQKCLKVQIDVVHRNPPLLLYT
jgi:hypothetical protein